MYLLIFSILLASSQFVTSADNEEVFISSFGPKEKALVKGVPENKLTNEDEFIAIGSAAVSRGVNFFPAKAKCDDKFRLDYNGNKDCYIVRTSGRLPDPGMLLHYDKYFEHFNGNGSSTNSVLYYIRESLGDRRRFLDKKEVSKAYFIAKKDPQCREIRFKTGIYGKKDEVFHGGANPSITEKNSIPTINTNPHDFSIPIDTKYVNIKFSGSYTTSDKETTSKAIGQSYTVPDDSSCVLTKVKFAYACTKVSFRAELVLSDGSVYTVEHDQSGDDAIMMPLFSSGSDYFVIASGCIDSGR